MLIARRSASSRIAETRRPGLQPGSGLQSRFPDRHDSGVTRTVSDSLHTHVAAGSASGKPFSGRLATTCRFPGIRKRGPTSAQNSAPHQENFPIFVMPASKIRGSALGWKRAKRQTARRGGTYIQPARRFQVGRDEIRSGLIRVRLGFCSTTEKATARPHHRYRSRDPTTESHRIHPARTRFDGA